MAYNTALADRVRKQLMNTPDVSEKIMFSGIAFMVNDKLCICVRKTDLMCRIDPSRLEELVKKDGVQQMIMKGRKMNGYVTVTEDAVANNNELLYWVNLCLAFNPKAKSSKQKSSKQ